jgi:uncharacterized membrane protein YbaN (DUF454 family)
MLGIIFWRLLALIFIALGFIGAMLPVMPTTVFLIMALWAAGKGWPQLHDWLLNHPQFGHHLRNWQDERAVPLSAKIFATLGMAFGLSLVVYRYGINVWFFIIAFTMAAILIWLWRLPVPSDRH